MGDLPEINLISLNCWGLKFVSKFRHERLVEIGRRVAAASPAPDIVAFQELFTQEDYHAVRRETRHLLPHGKFYFSGAFGGGLAILSRWPIEQSSMVPYPLNGRPAAFWRGDWYVGKGVACARLRYGPNPKDVIEVFNTHTHAPYESSYMCHRLAQSWEVAKLLRGACERGHLVLGLGDFNMRAGSLHHRIVTANAPVRDAWRVLHPDSALGAADDPFERARGRPIPTAEFNVVENGATSDSPYCTWRWPVTEQKRHVGQGKSRREVPPNTPDRKGKRLDYIFVGDGQRHRAKPGGEDHDGKAPLAGWVVKSAKVGMMEPHPRLNCSVSDHFSVEATIAFHVRGHAPRRQESISNADDDEDVDNPVIANGTYLESPTASDVNLPHTDRAPSRPRSRSRSGLSTTTTTTTTQSISESGPQFEPQNAVPRTPRSPNLDDQLGPKYPSHCDNLPLTRRDYDEILSSVNTYSARQSSQRRLRSLHFLAWTVAWLACLVGVWFAPPFASFVMLLVCSLGLVAGTIDGLMALLFFGSEMGALREFEWEVLAAQAVAGQDGNLNRKEGEEQGS